ncbi:acyltransferase domain-containing protein [Streptomyces sp. NPDC047315]|uniref:acyltransferase domain-containing protein n=1 Tax=Streptomyces sp. NPDC047315 TaxID=3155142 RepID=UPI003406C486
MLVFPGQGSQWAGMGVELLDSSPVFAERIAACEAALKPHVDWSLTDVLRGDGTELARVDVVQPVLWAVMVSLAAVWAEHGVTPAAVIGHSQGEIAAACVAGALSLEDGARIVALRSRALRALSGGGAMASLGLSAADAEGWFFPADGGGVVVAAVNGPSSTVISGPPQHVADVVTAVEAAGHRARTIDVDYASHGPQVDEITEELHHLLAGIEPTTSTVAFYSTVTAGPVDTTELDTGYWVRNLREQVRFSDTVHALLDAGHRLFVEASPHPVLTLGLEQIFDTAAIEAVAIPTLRRDAGGPTQLTHALAHAHTTATPINWTPNHTHPTHPHTDLPTYAFQRERFWLEDVAPLAAATAGEPDEGEERFWSAVEGGDAQTASAVLGLAADDGANPALTALLPVLGDWRRSRNDRSTADSWRYRVRWDRLTAPAEAPPPAGPWLLVRPAGGDAGACAWAETCAEALTAGGRSVNTLDVGPDADRFDLAARLRSYPSDGRPAGVLSLLALADGDPADDVNPGIGTTLALLQALVDSDLTAPLWCATRGAVAATDADAPDAPHQAQLWGLGRVAALEHPEQWGGLLDLPATPHELRPEQLRTALLGRYGDGGEDQIALRPDGAYGRRLAPVPVESPTSGAAPDPKAERGWTPSGTVLVTGGTGALACHLARWLAGGGAQHVVLLDVAGDDAPAGQALRTELAASGVELTVVACNPADPVDTARSVGAAAGELAAAGAPIGTVLHTSVTGDLAPLAELTPRQLTAAVRTARDGAAPHLADVCAAGGQPVRTVHFTSAATTWGSRDHGAYAAAHAGLAATAAHRSAAGLDAVSHAWGLWELTDDDRGAPAGLPLQLARRQGLAPLDPRLAVVALQELLAGGAPDTVVADVDWSTFLPLFTLARKSRLFDAVPAAHGAGSAPQDGEGSSDDVGAALRKELAALPAADREARLLTVVRTQAAAVLRYRSPEQVGVDRPFKELGFDSIAAVDLRNRLRAGTGVSLSATAAFDHPTPGALTAHLLGEVLRDEVADDTADGHLDAVEGALDALPADDPRRAALLNRLRSVLWKHEAPAARDEEGADGDDDLTAATAAEMFALVDREFGA